MALKDLVSDLSNFKGQSQYDSLDNQIKKGVDFFDNETGGADGFTPKTDLESRYHKVRDGNISAPNAGVRLNDKTRSAYGTFGEYSEAGNPGLSNPSHVLSADNILGVRIQPQFLSDFMDFRHYSPIWSFTNFKPLFILSAEMPQINHAICYRFHCIMMYTFYFKS